MLSAVACDLNPRAKCSIDASGARYFVLIARDLNEAGKVKVVYDGGTASDLISISI